MRVLKHGVCSGGKYVSSYGEIKFAERGEAEILNNARLARAKSAPKSVSRER